MPRTVLDSHAGRDAQAEFFDRPPLNPIAERAVEMDARVEHFRQQGLVHADELAFPRLDAPRLPADAQFAGAPSGMLTNSPLPSLGESGR